MQILTQSNLSSNSQSDLKTLSIQFFQGTILKQLLASHSPTTVDNLKNLAAEFWSEEDSIDNFLAFLRKQRQEAI
ncbi:MAG: hypothetical protein RMY28_003330 [Nostoc sp. ChiSLP01]